MADRRPDSGASALMRTDMFARLYGESTDEARRYMEAAKRLGTGVEGVRFFSGPGRIEVSGNHTDHNGGRVVCAAIGIDAVAAVTATGDNVITVRSRGYKKAMSVDVTDVEPKSSEQGTSAALIRGIAAAIKQRGYKAGGFRAEVSSNVAVGSGLSSSAAFEMLIAVIINSLYNEGRISSIELAQAAQYAENHFYGKPSGLMDQLASAVGGLCRISFENPDSPEVSPFYYDFDAAGYDVVTVAAGGGHEGLDGDYAGIPADMVEVAAYFGKKRLIDVGADEFYSSLGGLKKVVSGRAISRAAHFFDENVRVDAQYEALVGGDIEGFLRMVRLSGLSSWTLLQNIHTPSDTQQSLALALMAAGRLLGVHGAARVHGGGFAGTVLCFVPKDMTREFAIKMDDIFGEGAVKKILIRAPGACEVC